jgi:hypothetical protein
MPLLPLRVPPRQWSRADRFRIMKNLGEALEGCLARHLAAKRQRQTKETVDAHSPIQHAPRSVRRSPKVEHLHQAYREERLARYEQVVADAENLV